MAMFAGGFPPGPHAGDISPRTTMLRPRLSLTDEQCNEARRLRRSGATPDEIAAEIDCHVEDVILALAAMRTRRRAPTRASLNVTLAARDFVSSEGRPGESTWQTVDRLFNELARSRSAGRASGVPH